MDIERKAFIFNIQKYNMYDGPGVRTIVFFKGCPLRCKWCSNPEGMEQKHQVMLKKTSCINCGACVSACPQGIHRISKEGNHEVDREITCRGCLQCKETCPQMAIEITGETKTIAELLKIVKEDEFFYQMSGGGVTLGGGECTSQPEAAGSLLRACKQGGINTAIETCGYTDPEKFLEIAEYVDLFLFDIKHMDPERHNELTGVSNDLILRNLNELLKRRYNIKIRMPILKGINDSQEEMEAVIAFLRPYRAAPHFKGIDLLPYHKMGVNKYNQLDKEYPLEGDKTLSENDISRIRKWLEAGDFPITIVRH